MKLPMQRKPSLIAPFFAAASFLDGAKNVSIYFGISTTQHTMHQKLKELVPNDVILKGTSDTLAGYEFGIAIFNNSQMFMKLKFQRDGKSSSSTIVTSTSFIKPTIPANLDSIQFQEEAEMEMAYIQQPVPSAPGMPQFEDITALLPGSFLQT